MEAIATPRLSKKIALFSDGTGNSSAKAQKTNVWRLFQALDQRTPDQIAKYDDGVGTSSNKYLAILGGAFGWGLKRNVIDLYKFVCRNYNEGDDIYGFGFSRGAFTIRVLVGLIAREGLVTFRSEAELDHRAAAAYRSYRYKAFPSFSPIVWIFRKLRDLFLYVRNRIQKHDSYATIEAATKAAARDQIPIRFLGLWDTVEAYGMPIAELKRGINWVLWPMLFGDLHLDARVKRAVHALSLDDERTTFHPLLWDEEWEAQLVATNPALAGRLTQVWFAGVHSNVGGGYPEDRLSHVPLQWIMEEAAINGLVLIHDEAQTLIAAQSPYARLYDSRAGFAAYYRYSPRQTPRFSYKGSPLLSTIHWSVLARMTSGSDSYAPIILPHTFNILTPSGAVMNLHQLSQSLHNQGTLTTGSTDLDAALKQLHNPNPNEVGLVWDTVFWRRCLYGLTMALTLVAAAFPAVDKLLPNSWLVINGPVRGPIAAIVNALNGVIPASGAPWKEALTQYPLEFGFLLIAIALTLLGSQSLEQRIHDRARLIWSRQPIDAYRQWRDERRSGFRQLIVVCLILTGGALIALPLLGKLNQELGFAITAALLLMVLIASILGHRPPPNAPATRVRSTRALKIARIIRENPVLIWLYGALTQYVIPVLFALMLVVAGLFLLNRAVFDTVSSAGLYCKGSIPRSVGELDEKLDYNERTFTTDQMCWASGLVLKQGHRYLITLTTNTSDATDARNAIDTTNTSNSTSTTNTNQATHRWFDRDIPTDVTGFPTDSSRHWSARLLTRWWNQPWFKPIARIGRFGNDEYVLDPIDDIAPLVRPRCLDALHMPSNLPIGTKIDETLAEQINDCEPVPNDRKILNSVIKANSDGELFLYVNDAVISIPGYGTQFFDNNSGTATVRVVRLTSDAVAAESKAVPSQRP
jgi:uncharacterized protein (DUF2235 family)